MCNLSGSIAITQSYAKNRKVSQRFSKVDKVWICFWIMSVKKFLVSNYKKCWDFLVECRWFVVGIVGLFCLSFLVGFVYPNFFVSEIIQVLKEIALKFEGKGLIETIWLIFSNNVLASGIAMGLGILFGVFPLVSCVINGYMVGFVGRYAAEIDGVGVLMKLLPHGVFELPAVLISMGIGLRLGFQVLRVGSGRYEVGGIKKVLKEGLRFFVFVVVPLLVVAAVIEGGLIFVFA